MNHEFYDNASYDSVNHPPLSIIPRHLGKKEWGSWNETTHTYIGMVVLNHNWIVLLYSRKIWQGIKFSSFIKFGGLAVRIETAKFNSATIVLHTVRNDVMHAVALLALSDAPLRKLYM